MPQAMFLDLIVGLAAGLVAIALLPRCDGRFAPAVASMRVCLLLYNVWLAADLACAYLRIYVPMRPEGASALEYGAVLVVGLFGLAWLYSHIVLVDRLRRGTDRRVALVFRVLAFLLAGLLVAAWLVAVATGDRGLLPLLSWTVPLLLSVGLASNVWLLVAMRRSHASESRAEVSRLAVAFVALFAAFLALGLFARRFAAYSPVLAFSCDLVLGLAYDALPVVWARRLRPEPAVAQSGANGGNGRGHIDALVARYRITPREREVVEMVCLGQTNQEIADRLFISVRTVKDHNSLIFQKTGVRNRTELARLFSNGAH